MIGVDFGGTRIKAGQVKDGVVLRRVDRSTPASEGPAVVLDAIAELVHRLERHPERVGLAIPGEVDDAGRCHRLPNVPGFEGVFIARELSLRLGCPVAVENDGTTAALGELRHGHGARYPSFLLATLGTGIGGGLCIDGKVRRGRHGFAAELGHVLVDSGADAWPCVCGQRGCLETIAGSRGLLRHYTALGGHALSLADLAAAARAGEPAAQQVFARMGHALGVALAQAQKLLDLDALIFTGGVSASFDLVEPSLRDALRAHVFGEPTSHIPLLVSQLGADAGLIGAAELAQSAT